MSRNLQVNYITSGWVAHHRSDIWAKASADMGNPKWAIWPMAGAWVCTHLWEHYTYTLDKVRDIFFHKLPVTLLSLIIGMLIFFSVK